MTRLALSSLLTLVAACGTVPSATPTDAAVMGDFTDSKLGIRCSPSDMSV